MIEFAKAHYGKLVAFITGWIAEAYVELSAYLKAIFAAAGIGGE